MWNLFKKNKEKKTLRLYSYDSLQKHANGNSFDVKKIKFQEKKEKLVKLLKKAKISLTDHLYMILKSSAENHIRIQKLKIQPIKGDQCSLSFQSYADLKRYQKKVRLFTYSFSSTVASVMVAMLVMQVFFPSQKSLGATYTFTQSSWLGGLTANTAAHPVDMTNWNQYSSKGGSIAAGSEIKLTTSPGSITQTNDTDFTAAAGVIKRYDTDADFSSGTFSGMAIFGTGNSTSLGAFSVGSRADYSSGGSATMGVVYENVTNSVWICNYSSANVTKLNIETGEKTLYATGLNPRSIAFDTVTNSVWVSNYGSDTVSKINVSTGGTSSYAVGDGPVGVTFDSVTNSIWVANFGAAGANNTVNKINVNDGTSVSYTVGTGPFGIAFDNVTNSIWVANAGSNTVSKVNIDTGTSSAYAVGSKPWMVAFDNFTNSAWVTNGFSNTVSKVNINTGTSSTVVVGTYPMGIAFDSVTNSVWVANNGVGSSGSTISKVNVTNGTKVDYPLTSAPYGVAFDAVNNTIWTTVGGSRISKVAINDEMPLSGTYVSNVFDAGSAADFSKLEYSATIPADTTLSVDVRAGNTATPDESWTQWQTNIPNNGSMAGINGNRYFQYKVSITMTNNSSVPVLQNINFYYYSSTALSSQGINIYTSLLGTGSSASIQLSKTETADTWSTMTAASAASQNGGLAYDGNGNIFAAQGYSGGAATAGFWKYNISRNAWYTMASLPAVAKDPRLAYDGNGNIFALRGNDGANPTSNFYKYNIATNTWSSMTNTPGATQWGSVAADGAGSIYVRRGHTGTANSSEIWKYTIATNAWSTMNPAPAVSMQGAFTNYNSTYMFLVNGYDGVNTSAFYRYDKVANSWITRASMPGGSGRGDIVSHLSSGTLFAAQGMNESNVWSDAFWAYSVSGNSWQTKANLPGLANGGTMTYDAGNNIYFKQGATTAFWKYSVADRYQPSGSFVSSVMDTGQKSFFSTVTYNTTKPTNTNVSVDVRSGNTPAPDNTWTQWQMNVASAGDISSLSGNRYVQYRANLSTSSLGSTPSLNDITISYLQYPVSSLAEDVTSLTSSAFDTGQNGNVVSRVSWVESLSGGADARLQIRTSADNLNWSQWLGPDGTNSTYFSDPAGGDSVPVAFSDNLNDRWIQYKVFLNTDDGSATPTVSSVGLQYVVNSPPELQSVSASQGTDGLVIINYDVRDQDTDSGATPNKVNISLEYCSANCSDVGNETWVAASTVSGDVGANVVAQQETWSSGYQIQWLAKNDFSNQFNSADFKIRVKADDSEGASNLAYLQSGVFSVFDTKAPTLGAIPIFVDSTTSPAALTLSASDDTALEMKISLNSDLSGASWESYNSSKNITLTTNPQTVYVQFKDAYSNTSEILSATTPETPNAVMIQDTSNLNFAPAEYRLFVAWKTVNLPVAGFGSYKVYRSTDQNNWDLVGTVTDRQTNYYGDNSILNDSNYYYKVATVDVNGSISAYSQIVNGKANGIQDAGEGGGGTGSVPPVISDVTDDQGSSTSMMIYWQTDKPSDSIVSYQTEAGGDFTNALLRGSLQMADNDSGLGRHGVLLTGLSPNQMYYYKVTSRDANGGLTSDALAPDGHAFTTFSGPTISLGSVDVNNDSATITWTTSSIWTTSPIESKISYATAISGGALVNPITISSTGTASHSAVIENLTANTSYYFSISATDSSGGTTIANNSGNFYAFTSVSDSTDPVISSISNPIVTTDMAAIAWKTDEAATSQVGYATNSGGPYTKTTTIMDYDKNHTVILNVSSDQDYYYVVYSEDIYGNSATSDEYSFTSAKPAELNHDPLSDITFAANNPSVLTDLASVISFSTDQAANCYVEYGTASGNYTYTPVGETENLYNITHSIPLTGLLFNTQYFYKVTCQDNLGTVKSSEEKEFTTKEKMIAVSTAGGDDTAPVISNVRVTGITGESVVVTWDTDEKSSSSIRYGIANTDEFGALESAVNKSVKNYSTNHTVVIHGLIPATKYLFIASSADASGNISDSSQDSFTTASPSSLSSIKALSLELGEAIITWNTDKETTSVVEYGLSTSYGEKKESSSATKQHSVNLTGLQQGETYHFRVKGKDSDGFMYSSSDNTFEPKSPPRIREVSINGVTEHGAIVSFSTDVATDAVVSYINVADAKDNGAQSSTERASKHSIELKNLSQGTTYSLKVKVTDEQGTESQQEAEDLTTGRDENPPKIDQVHTDTALTQSDKVQSIISWKTDEQSDTVFIYKEGKNGIEKEVKISDNLTTSHIAVVTVFKPGTVYYFKVKSSDASDNAAISNDFALLTPKRKENIIQIIINNFQEIFGWARK